jgi:hypothetical protein
MNDVLIPLGRQYSLNVVTGLGEMSLTTVDKLIERIESSQRSVRILYISDFDPGGHRMPVSVARKIEFRHRNGGINSNFQLRPVVLTQAQCEQFDLPETPIAVGDSQREKFKHAYGRDATELDALEALRPGVLRQILVSEIERYFDKDFAGNVREEIKKVETYLAAISENVLRNHDDEIEELRKDYKDLTERYNQEYKNLAERYNKELAPKNASRNSFVSLRMNLNLKK